MLALKPKQRSVIDLVNDPAIDVIVLIGSSRPAKPPTSRPEAAPQHLVEGYLLRGDDLINFRCSDDELQGQLADFDRGVLTHQGARWQVRWFDAEDSQRVREEHGFEPYPR